MAGSPWDAAFGARGDAWDILGGTPMAADEALEAPESFDTTEKSIEYVKRIKNVQSEIQLLQEDIKEIFREAEEYGIDANVLRDVLRRSKKTKAEIEAHDTAVASIELRLEGRDEFGEDFDRLDDEPPWSP